MKKEKKENAKNKLSFYSGHRESSTPAAHVVKTKKRERGVPTAVEVGVQLTIGLCTIKIDGFVDVEST